MLDVHQVGLEVLFHLLGDHFDCTISLFVHKISRTQVVHHPGDTVFFHAAVLGAAWCSGGGQNVRVDAPGVECVGKLLRVLLCAGCFARRETMHDEQNPLWIACGFGHVFWGIG